MTGKCDKYQSIRAVKVHRSSRGVRLDEGRELLQIPGSVIGSKSPRSKRILRAVAALASRSASVKRASGREPFVAASRASWVSLLWKHMAEEAIRVRSDIIRNARIER